MQNIPMQLMPFVRMSKTELICYDNLPPNLIPLFEKTKKKLKEEMEDNKQKFTK